MPAIEVANLHKRYGDAVATVGLTVMPAYLATYRERGVLRRLATMPASPNHLRTAQMMVKRWATTMMVRSRVSSAVSAVWMACTLDGRPRMRP
jgi:hypothetical protein